MAPPARVDSLAGDAVVLLLVVLAAFVITFAAGFLTLFAASLLGILAAGHSSLGFAAVLGAAVDATFAVLGGAGGVGAHAFVGALVGTSLNLASGVGSGGVGSFGFVAIAGSHSKYESCGGDYGKYCFFHDFDTFLMFYFIDY